MLLVSAIEQSTRPSGSSTDGSSTMTLRSREMRRVLTAAGKLQIEAEQMDSEWLSRRSQGRVDASGGKLIKLSKAVRGTASLDFSVEQAGTYDVTVWYYDENDGKSEVTLEVGSTVETLDVRRKDKQRPCFERQPSLRESSKVLSYRAGLNTLKVSRQWKRAVSYLDSMLLVSVIERVSGRRLEYGRL